MTDAAPSTSIRAQLGNGALLHGRRVLVTGGARGIGRAVAEAVVAHGGSVAILDVLDDGRSVADDLRRAGGIAFFERCDVTCPEHVAEAVARSAAALGGVDGLVNNAGINAYYDAATMTTNEWDATFDIDVKASWLLVRHALPHLLASDGAAIVNVSSIHATVTVAGMFPYAAAKAAVEGLTRSLALDYGGHGLRVNAIAPGFVRTHLVREWLERQPDPAEAERQVVASHPLGRIAEPEEIAACIVFLLSPMAAAMTGTVLHVDCGLTARFAT
jgi:NAD(P)-dependent dehydrogenase (short-subunit alcohol dehydrogenase family)